ncbi:type I-F CRISPR-associated protein Csy3 [Billgrantia sulfidoxydans]|uniref:Type I-F CRISPR-associated protein Csy3 n=1 Tax=Billgrantia sulfidoxydans TaxID=2733484 RepID=A0ABX7W6S5_9GAMM|nr:type I-F CRISPR-associated protein Csy3 [Halomonas sulfidoxydans]QTP54689.1 type I-F CRISPR-associated protein Csy3 [Halomonas sulfidoxydans]
MISLCSNLSYERSLSPGKAVFYYKTPLSNFEPLEVDSYHSQGVKASYSEGYASAGKVRDSLILSKLGYGNLFHSESCFVPPNIEDLYCRFSLRIQPGSMQPLVCSDRDLNAHMKMLAANYRDAGGFDELARRYCINLLDGSWLWKNQHARELEISLKVTGCDEELSVKNLHFWGKNPKRWDEHSQYLLGIISDGMSRALHDPRAFWFADVTARMKVEFCQEVYPSQVLVTKDSSDDVSGKRLVKTKTCDGREAASFSSTKVGAAIQMIDDWWEADAEKALRVSEYGADRSSLIARRGPKSGQDFYSILSQSDHFLKDGSSGKDISAEYHYLMAVLVKGGLFQKGK